MALRDKTWANADIRRTRWKSIETYDGLGASLLGKRACQGKARLGLQVSAMFRQIILAAFIVLLPTSVQAQARGMMATASRSMAVAPRVVLQAPRAGTAQLMPGARVVVRSGGTRPRTGTPTARITSGPVSTRRRAVANNRGLRPDCNSAPGLGFDAVHQAAVCGSTSFGSRGFQAPLFFPFFDGGFFLPGSAVTTEESSAAETAQPEETDTEARETHRRTRASQAAAAPAPAAETAGSALPSNDEFVFVRRDGTVFFAVAYSWEGGTLRYVTNQGLRRTVKQDALDMGATQQFNEQRGLSFRSPA